MSSAALLESTVVIAMGEFGRTPHINPDHGRDHWPECWSVVLGGGGIRGGQIIGASDERGAYVADRMVTMGDIYATIYKAFGIDWEKTYMTAHRASRSRSLTPLTTRPVCQSRIWSDARGLAGS